MKERCYSLFLLINPIHSTLQGKWYFPRGLGRQKVIELRRGQLGFHAGLRSRLCPSATNEGYLWRLPLGANAFL